MEQFTGVGIKVCIVSRFIDQRMFSQGWDPLHFRLSISGRCCFDGSDPSALPLFRCPFTFPSSIHLQVSLHFFPFSKVQELRTVHIEGWVLLNILCRSIWSLYRGTYSGTLSTTTRIPGYVYCQHGPYGKCQKSNEKSAHP